MGFAVKSGPGVYKQSMAKVLLGGTLILSVFGIESGSLAAETAMPIAQSAQSTRCEMSIDDEGMPHIRPSLTKTEQPTPAVQREALDFCIGYLHGRFRAWQMDFLLRTALGRRSEVEGRKTLRQDLVMRFLDLESRAKTIYRELPDEIRGRLEAYTLGVNAGQREAKAAGIYEFKALGGELLAWEPQATVALLLLQSFDQTRKTFETVFDDYRHSQSEPNQFGSLPQLARTQTPWWTTVIKDQDFVGLSASSRTSHKAAVNPSTKELDRGDIRLSPKSTDRSEFGRPRRVTQKVGEAFDFWSALAGLEQSPVPSQGSNNWVIAPDRSVSGRPLLANDPHLGLKHPPFWMALHAEVSAGSIAELGANPASAKKSDDGASGGSAKDPLVDVMGVTLPGVPVVVSGLNRHVTWGLTNSYLPASTVSLVSESEIDRSPEMESFRPMVKVRVGSLLLPFFFKSFKRMKDGTLILPSAPGIPNVKGYVWALQWSGAKVTGADLAGLWGIAESKSASDIDQRLSKIGLSSWNFVFADREGNIGYRAVGKILRSAPQSADLQKSMEPQPVSVAELGGKWNFLNSDEMPHLMNPKRGYVVTANNTQWPQSMPEQFRLQGRSQVESFRAHRIEERLQGTQKLNQDQMKSIQCDVQAVDARYFTPVLLAALLEANAGADHGVEADPKPKLVIRTLREWAEKGYLASPDCEACAPYRIWINELKQRTGLGESELWALLSTPSTSNKGVSGEAAGVKRAHSPELLDVIHSAFEEVVRQTKLVTDGTVTRLAAWSELHQSEFEHWAGREVLAAPSIPTPGDDHTVNPGTSRQRERGFDHWAGASYRMVVEMSATPSVWQSLPGPLEDLERSAGKQLPSKAWQDWTDCKHKKKAFPLAWTELRKTVVPF